MKIKSKYDTKEVEGRVKKVFAKKIFNTDFSTVSSGGVFIHVFWYFGRIIYFIDMYGATRIQIHEY